MSRLMCVIMPIFTFAPFIKRQYVQEFRTSLTLAAVRLDGRSRRPL